MKKVLYIFLDEGGDFNFTETGTKYFTLSCISKTRPFEAFKELNELKYDLVESGEAELEYFHASEDRQAVRDQVFNIINKCFNDSVIDSLIVQKNKTYIGLRKEERFYKDMFRYLIKYVIQNTNLSDVNKIIIFTDRLPLNKKRNAIEKGIKEVLSDLLESKIIYTILHHSSKSNYDLQLADYCNWAIYRKWNKGDLRSYDLIRKYIRSEFDIFKNGKTLYY